MKKTWENEILKPIVERLVPLNRRTIAILRFELNALVSSFAFWVFPKYRGAFRKAIKSPNISVNLGSGGRGDSGWVNVDVYRHHADLSFPFDIRKGLPFPTGSVCRIFAEHVLEHLEFREDVPRFLEDACRSLETGGSIRIVVPDGEKWLRAYVAGDQETWKALGVTSLPDDMPTYMSLINHVFQQDGEHFFAYDYVTLEWALKQAGFSNIRRSAWRQPSDPGMPEDQENHRLYSLYVDANK